MNSKKNSFRTKEKMLIVILIILILVFISYLSLLFFPIMIKINGEEEIYVNCNSTYIDEWITIWKNIGSYKTFGYVDTSKIGSYEIKYKYLFTSIKRKVTVIDREKPIITLTGKNIINLNINDEYKELGYVAIDNCDGDITKNVKIESNIESKKTGTYKVKYSVSDSSENEGFIERVVEVKKQNPLTMNKKDFTLNGYFEGTILKKTGYNQQYFDGITFFGDSIMGNFGFFGLISTQKSFWTRSSLDPENVYSRIININGRGSGKAFLPNLKIYKPERVMILIGSNAMSFVSIDYFIKNYEKFIINAKQTSPNTDFIVMSIFPVDKRYDKNGDRNDKINKINYYLAEICQKQNIKFLNAAEIIKDENGQCKSGYCYLDDGIHLTVPASKLVIEYIKTHTGV